MDRIRRTLPLRRVAWMAALAALTLPAGQAEAAKKVKAPVITSVSPMKAAVGETLTIKGRNFRKGKGRNSVGFKRDGSAVIFVKSDISTARMLKVKVPARLEEQMTNQGTTKLAARFRLRILTSRFGPSFTSVADSPLIGPRVPKDTAGTPGSGSNDATAPTPPAAEADCDNDGQVNSVDLDDDNDLLPDTLENVLGTNGCKADSDDDTVEDGYEYRSAVDLNDDEYQSPNVALPYPGKRPYPNALDKSDAKVDYDGDGLTVAEEYGLWKASTPVAQRTFADVAGKVSPLNYSAGLTYSVSSSCKDVPGNPLCGAGDDNRRVPTLAAATYDKWLAFTGWAGGAGYDPVRLHDSGDWYGHSTGRTDYRLLDVDRSGGAPSARESMMLDHVEPGDRGQGWLDDGERDEDGDGLSNVDELKSRMTPEYWTACYTAEPVYPVSYAGTDYLNPDSDGDGVLDGADDQDHDDVPNIMELSRWAALGGRVRNAGLDETDDGVQGTTNGGGATCTPDPDLDASLPRHSGRFGQVNPFNPCEPDPASRTCALFFEFGTLPAPFAGPDWWALQ